MAFEKRNREIKSLSDKLAIPFISEFGKLPPQAVDLEEAVLGAIMLEYDAMEKVSTILSPQAFYKEIHQTIYKIFQSMYEKGEKIDMMTVTHHLRKENMLEEVGGAFFISQLTNRVGSAAHIEYHSRIISQKHIQRELIRISSEIQKDAYDEQNDVFDLLDQAERKLFAIAEGNISKQYEGIEPLLAKTIKHIESIKESKDGISGIPSGFYELDKITAGWQNNNLIIIAARPGMGKTAFALSVCSNAAIQFAKKVAIFTLEMESVELVTRMISSEAKIAGSKLKSGKLEAYEWEQLHSKVKALGESHMFIDDQPVLSMFQLRSKCRRIKSQYGLDMVVVDYLQLMKGDDSAKATNREQEISYISRSLKALSKELAIPIIALAQLNRDVEKRKSGGGGTPLLSDLRESGSIEQDADIVMFIHRPEVYGLTELPASDGDGMVDMRGVAEIIIAKHRNGANGKVSLRFQGEYTKFSDLNLSENTFDAEPEIKLDAGVIKKPSKMNDWIDNDETPF